MQSLLFFATLATLFLSALSAPTTDIKALNHTGTHPSLRSENDPELYYLKTKVMFPNPLHRFASPKDNLYMTSFHNGAGLADAVFTSNKTRARAGYLRDDTRFGFPIGGLDWFLGLVHPRPYEMWHPVKYSVAGAPTSGFFFNTTINGLECKLDNVFDPLQQWQGWLVCDWNEGKQQLFWWTPRVGDGTLPTSCDVITLVKEMAN